MSSAQVAEYLGITRDALHARIRARDFIAPDALIGERFQGWRATSVEKYRQQQEGIGFHCDTQGLIAVIEEIRTIAERIRTYGRQLDAAADEAFLAVPTNLYVVSARLESSLRDWLVVEADNVAILQGINLDGRSARAADNHAATRIQLSIEPVESYSAVNTTQQERATELLAASNELSAVIARLPTLSDWATARLAARVLTVEKSVIDDKLRDLEDAAAATLGSERV